MSRRVAIQKSVTVQLFDDSASPSPACSTYSSPVATQTLTYVSGDGGRKTLSGNFNLSSAYRMRCRVTDTNSAPTVYGCSTDTFSVRPQSINSVTSTANADGAGASTTATPAIKAGAAFTITAGTGKPGYNGAPQIDSSKIEWPGVPLGGRAAPGVGTLGGLFLTAANGTTGNGASGTAFYSRGRLFPVSGTGRLRQHVLRCPATARTVIARTTSPTPRSAASTGAPLETRRQPAILADSFPIASAWFPPYSRRRILGASALHGPAVLCRIVGDRAGAELG